MPSYLADFKHGAKSRIPKFHRAVQSVIAQTNKEWELIIIADGCDLTMTEVERYKENRIIALKTAKQAWDSVGIASNVGVGALRNLGISESIGDYVCYLDTDDFFGIRHLELINQHIEGNEWLWWCDWKFNGQKWYLYPNDINKRFHYGTANIAHQRNITARWEPVAKYGYDDLQFVDRLKQYPRFEKINAQYFVCHVPKNPIMQSYDI